MKRIRKPAGIRKWPLHRRHVHLDLKMVLDRGQDRIMLMDLYIRAGESCARRRRPATPGK